VTFRRGVTVRRGKVVWASGQQFGIRFSHPLEDDELRLHFPQPVWIGPANGPRQRK
jgi:hypothetical protein